MLWSIYQEPRYTAALELSVAARTDPELREQLRRVADNHRRLALQAVISAFPSIGKTRAESLIETIHAAFVGLCLQGGVTAEPHHIELVLESLERLVVSHLSKD